MKLHPKCTQANNSFCCHRCRGCVFRMHVRNRGPFLNTNGRYQLYHCAADGTIGMMTLPPLLRWNARSCIGAVTMALGACATGGCTRC